MFPSTTDLRADAERWILHNGQPDPALVEAAIRNSDASGDPLGDNPFRRVLLAVHREQTVTGRFCTACGEPENSPHARASCTFA